MCINISKKLKKEILDPGILSIFFNPYYFVKKGLIKGLHKSSRYISGKVLDFGCGNRSYEHLFDPKIFIGLEIYRRGHDHSKERIDLYYDGITIPFKNNSFDSILSIEVFEHVFNFGDILNELNRILKPDGYLLLTLPFVWEEHEQPHDFGRYTSFGIIHTLETHGFVVLELFKTTGYIETIFQMWNNYFYKKLFPKFKLLQKFCIPFFIFPSNCIGVVLSRLLPKNKDMYLNIVVVAKKCHKT